MKYQLLIISQHSEPPKESRSSIKVFHLKSWHNLKPVNGGMDEKCFPDTEIIMQSCKIVRWVEKRKPNQHLAMRQIGSFVYHHLESSSISMNLWTDRWMDIVDIRELVYVRVQQVCTWLDIIHCHRSSCLNSANKMIRYKCHHAWCFKLQIHNMICVNRELCLPLDITYM